MLKTMILFDTPELRSSLLPFSAIRSVAELRIGLFTMRERWEHLLGQSVYCLTEDYLEEQQPSESVERIYISSNILPDTNLIEKIRHLKSGSAIYFQEQLLAFCVDQELDYGFSAATLPLTFKQQHEIRISSFEYAHQIIQLQSSQLYSDLKELSHSKQFSALPPNIQHFGKYPVLIEQGAKLEPCYIHTDEGPVYIGKDVLIMAGSQLRGPLALLEGTVVKMGAQLYGGSTIGKQCIVGGEIKNSILMDYSNKAHHGYIGDSLIGSWCNLGAGSSCSNVKNTGGQVHVWNPGSSEWIPASRKCGVLMGDYVRAAINTSFNTGTVVGTGSQVICTGLTPKYIPDYTWNLETGEKTHSEPFLEMLENWMRFKQKSLSEKERRVLLRLLSKQI